MPAIRILIVDDSVVIRRVLCDVLSADPAIEVAGTAAEGHIAVSKIAQLNPDLVTLDVEMPGWSGIETLKEIRKQHAKLPVIMFSTLTERGAATTLEALSLGASDYATKPGNTGSREATAQQIELELIPKIKALCRRPTTRTASAPTSLVKSKLRGRPQRIDLVAIGTSTGGPNALAEVLPKIAADFPAPIVIVQHMPPLFTRMLAERLDKQSSIRVREGEANGVVENGTAWIAPGDHHMVVERRGTAVRLRLNQERPENSCRPAVDALFRSVAQTFGANALGVVLTGMGSDGLLGAQAMREAGAQIIVQDEASAVVWGMPGQVATAGYADGVHPLKQIAQEITWRVKSNRSKELTLERAGSGPEAQNSMSFSSAPAVQPLGERKE